MVAECFPCDVLAPTVAPTLFQRNGTPSLAAVLTDEFALPNPAARPPWAYLVAISSRPTALWYAIWVEFGDTFHDALADAAL